MRWSSYKLVIGAMFAICAGQAQAGELTLPQNMNLYPPVYGDSGIELAANDTGTMSDASSALHSDFKESAFTANKMHGYLGVASLASALLAGMTAPDNEGAVIAGQPAKKGFHHYAGITAAALGGAAVVSGLLLHADDLTPDFLDPDTAHMILGILGTAAYAYAVSKGPKQVGMGTGGHAAAGMAGAAVMAAAIYLEF